MSRNALHSGRGPQALFQALLKSGINGISLLGLDASSQVRSLRDHGVIIVGDAQGQYWLGDYAPLEVMAGWLSRFTEREITETAHTTSTFGDQGVQASLPQFSSQFKLAAKMGDGANAQLTTIKGLIQGI